MNPSIHARRARRGASLLLLTLSVGCGDPAATDAATPAAAIAAGPLRIALVPPAGTTPLDQQIRDTQAKIRGQDGVTGLERLATLFISKARSSGDPGFYKQAEACADAMPATGGGLNAARLVRGHVRHALHDFAGAERIARELVAARELFLDHGLLGDVLLDLGRLDEARDAYQRMIDLKPCLQSYARAAQLRWLRGDAAGCAELLELAAAAGSRRDPESLAWVLSRRAQLALQSNDADAAAAFADEALAVQPDYPAALLARGRAALAEERFEAAAHDLVAAARQSPLPEHLWAAADALRAAGRAAEADATEADLLRTGEREDPRTFALWLATRGLQPAAALRLAEAEFRTRQDVHTLDALALAKLRTGDAAGASSTIAQTLAVGVRDARVLAHAARIAAANGDRAGAQRHADAAAAASAALLPSERALLAEATEHR